MSNIFEEIATVRKRAAQDASLLTGPAAPGLTIAINQAKTKLLELESTFAGQLVKKQAAIALDGTPENVEEFLRLAKEVAPTPFLTLDVSQMYRDLARDCLPGVRFGSMFSITNFARLLLLVGTVTDKFDLERTRGLDFVDGVVIKSTEDLVNYVRNAVRKDQGDNLNRVYLQNVLVHKALSASLDMPVVPVLVTGSIDNEELTALFGKRFIKTTVTPEATADSVTKAFTQLKAKLKKV